MCVPNVTCSWPEDRGDYHSSFSCSGATAEEEADARKSFPSGHAAVVAYMAAFACLFLQRRPWALERFPGGGGARVVLIRPAVQVGVLLYQLRCHSR